MLEDQLRVDHGDYRKRRYEKFSRPPCRPSPGNRLLEPAPHDRVCPSHGNHQVTEIWKAADLKPHGMRSFKISNGPDFAEKVIDVVGLYMDPLDNALVLSVDEKTQIQALDRTQPMLQLKPGQVQRRTHDYKRHGTAILFAAFDVASR